MNHAFLWAIHPWMLLLMPHRIGFCFYNVCVEFRQGRKNLNEPVWPAGQTTCSCHVQPSLSHQPLCFLHLPVNKSITVETPPSPEKKTKQEIPVRQTRKHYFSMYTNVAYIKNIVWLVLSPNSEGNKKPIKDQYT